MILANKREYLINLRLICRERLLKLSPPDASCTAGTVLRVEGNLRAGAGGRARSPVARAGVAAQPAAVVEGGAGAAHRQAPLGLLLDLRRISKGVVQILIITWHCTTGWSKWSDSRLVDLPHLGDWSRDALSLPGDGAAGAGESGRRGPRLERRHGLRDAAGQRELLAELDVRASLGCKGAEERKTGLALELKLHSRKKRGAC